MKIRRILVLAITVGFFSSASAQDQPIRVRKVTFIGNSNIPARELKSTLHLTRGFWFAKKAFDRRLLKLDAITVKNFYLSKGYLAAEIIDSVAIQHNRADIFFRIREGKRYYISSINVVGNTILSTPAILKILGFQLMQPYNPVTANNQIPILEEEYHRYGKLYAKINIRDEVRDSVSININVKEGRDVYINQYFIEGEEPLKEKYVTREILIEPPSLYQKDLLDDSQRRIKETGVFSFVSMTPMRIAETDSMVNLLIELRHFKTREWVSEGGLYPVEFFEGVDPIPGLGGTLEWKSRSLFHTTTNFSTKLAVHFPFEQTYWYPKIKYNMGFANQWFLGFRLPTEISLYYETLKKFGQLEKPNIHRYGVALTNKYRFGSYSFFQTGIRWEKFLEPEQVKTDIEQRSIDLNLFLDQTDDPLFPSQGAKFNLDLTKTGGSILGGGRDYFKFDIGLSSYLGLFRKWVLAGRLKYGQIFGWKAGYEDLRFDLFYLGGSTSLRGWETLRFATRPTVGGALPAGSAIRVLTNWELRLPLFWLFGLELFVDGGILADEAGSVTFSKLRWNQGAGLTLRTPLGPIRLDYAYPVDNPNAWQIQLGVHYIF